MLLALGIFAICVGLFVGVVSSRPDHFRYQRSIVISAPPEKIYPYLDDPVKTAAWSPWEKKDPQMKKKFGGPSRGVGSVCEWDGNREVGAGRAEIISAMPDKVTLRLEFYRPMKAVNMAEYLMRPQGRHTEVVWSMYGPVTFAEKVFGLFVNCEKMVGGEFEKGLSDLKTLVEKEIPHEQSENS